MSINSKIKQLADKYNLEKDDFWQLPNNPKVWIIKHDAVERIAKQEGVIFENPTIVEHSREHCVLLGTACIMCFEQNAAEYIKVAEEWTFGEADIKLNCKNKYPNAMAEKRLKDRLTLKLISAYEYGVFSEDESDDFKKKDTQATPKQQGYIYDLLMHTAFTVGSGIKIKDDFSHQFEETFKSQENTSKFIERLKNHIKEFKNQQKEGKVV